MCFVGYSIGWLAGSLDTYCPSRSSELCENTLAQYSAQSDGPRCNNLTYFSCQMSLVWRVTIIQNRTPTSSSTTHDPTKGIHFPRILHTWALAVDLNTRKELRRGKREGSVFLHTSSLRIAQRDHTHMMSAKFWHFWPRYPSCRVCIKASTYTGLG